MNFGPQEPDFGFYAKPAFNSAFLNYLCSSTNVAFSFKKALLLAGVASLPVPAGDANNGQSVFSPLTTEVPLGLKLTTT
jgi:hypothetical protein